MSEQLNTAVYLFRIAHTISVILVWMITNLFFGIYLKYGFFTGKPGWENIVYYILAIGTLILVIKYLLKKWKPVNRA